MTLMFTFLPYLIQKKDTLPVGHTTPNPNGKQDDVITSKTIHYTLTTATLPLFLLMHNDVMKNSHHEGTHGNTEK